MSHHVIAGQETGAQHVRSAVSSVHCARKASRAIHPAALAVLVGTTASAGRVT